MTLNDKLDKLHWRLFQDDDPRSRANFRWLMINIIEEVIETLDRGGSLMDMDGVDDRRDSSGKDEVANED